MCQRRETMRKMSKECGRPKAERNKTEFKWNFTEIKGIFIGKEKEYFINLSSILEIRIIIVHIPYQLLQNALKYVFKCIERVATYFNIDMNFISYLPSLMQDIMQ